MLQSFCVYNLHFYPRIGTNNDVEQTNIHSESKAHVSLFFAHADLKENMVENFYNTVKEPLKGK